MSKSTTEEVVPMKALGTQSSAKAKFDLPAGKILGIVVYNGESGLNNDGMVRLEILNAANADVSKMQHIKNYRSREAGYSDGYKPLKIEGGKTYYANIVASEPFKEDTEFDLIFVYEDQDSNCEIN